MSVITELAVSNMEKSLEFYSLLGFSKTDDGIVDENGSQWSALALGDAALWLIRQDVVASLIEGEPRGNGVGVYIGVDDVDALYEKVSNAGMQQYIVKEIETMWYGLRQFTVADPDGYILTLNMQVEAGEAAPDGGQESANEQG